ncbi:hypothetical protein PM082_021823 [Marasmius tenuissimus]|nr:hypothetical protein PM082_021823 [Marasmius tenuissimus]
MGSCDSDPTKSDYNRSTSLFTVGPFEIITGILDLLVTSTSRMMISSVYYRKFTIESSEGCFRSRTKRLT